MRHGMFSHQQRLVFHAGANHLKRTIIGPLVLADLHHVAFQVCLIDILSSMPATSEINGLAVV